MHKRLGWVKTLWGILVLASFCVSAGMAFAEELEGELVVITSFPKELTVAFGEAFEAKYPGVKVEMLNKKTSAGVKYIQETASNPPDMFWASAPDAFEVLKGDDLLQKYEVKAQGIPEMVGAFPINDPDGYYKGFAASGYGIMYNTRYMEAKKLPVPKEWADLADPVYHGHVGISAPSRSGTTHLTVETIIQGEGWEKGWALMKDICGNLASVTERSFGVPEGVNNGTFGIGIVIDFFGLSSQATGYPVEFVYPTVTTLVPANIAIVNNAKHPKAAGAFIEFLLSEEGQEILLDPQIMRLPVNPAIYAKAPEGLPNPFEDKSIGAAVKFDLDLSKGRYNLFNSLFDQVITFRLESLVAATKAIQEGEALLAQKSDDKAAQLLQEARALVRAVPITEEEANNPEFAQIFEKSRKKVTDEVPQRQAEVEEQWDSFTKENYKAALAKAEEAIALLK